MPFIETAPGVCIHYESIGEGLPLVFIHGWSMSGNVWKLQAEDLASSYRFITIDLRGHGESSGSAGTFTFEDFAADTAELFTRLELYEAVLIGWSMGVQVAIQVCERIREHLKALVFVSGTPRFTMSDDYPFGLSPMETRGMALRLKRNYTRTMEEFFNGMFAEGEFSRAMNPALLREVVTGGKLPDPGAALKSLDTLASGDLRMLLQGIDVPVLLVHGSEDTVTMPAASLYMKEHLPRATLEIILGAGHAPFLSRPQYFNSLIRMFLEEIYGDN